VKTETKIVFYYRTAADCAAGKHYGKNASDSVNQEIAE
jgi:hypothetical protein